MDDVCIHCPVHDLHMDYDVLIVLGPIACGLFECPAEHCDEQVRFTILVAEVS